MQILPILGWLAGRAIPRRAPGAVWLAAALYATAIAATWLQARAGLPLIARPAG
jgi:hypothetical protein